MTSFAPVIVVLVVAACDNAATLPHNAVIHDSAGITIVENLDLALADSLSWSVDTTTALTIRVTDREPAYQRSRIAGFTRLSDGRIAIAEAIAHEVHFFDEHGKFINKVGKRGDGPGEFVALHRLLRHRADSLIVVDYEGVRLTLLGPRGEFVRRFGIHHSSEQFPVELVRAYGVFADGTLLVTDNSVVEKPPPGTPADVEEVRAVFARVTEGSEVRTRFGTRVIIRHQIVNANGEPMVLSGADVFWQVRERRFYYADSRSFEVRVHTDDGSLERIVRVAFEPPLRTPQTPDLNLEAFPNLEQRKRVQDQAEASYKAKLSQREPAFAGFLVDLVGNLWLEEYQEPGNERPSRWFVFDSTGVLRYSLRLPYLFLLPYGAGGWRGEIGDDYILGMRLEGDAETGQVETVQLLNLKKRTP